jgi:hypothetical protein
MLARAATEVLILGIGIPKSAMQKMRIRTESPGTALLYRLPVRVSRNKGMSSVVRQYNTGVTAIAFNFSLT